MEHANRVRGFFKDVLQLGSVDAGRGWLIFALPPAEFASPVKQEQWVASTAIKLPGGGEMGLYGPRYPTALKLNRRSTRPQGNVQHESALHEIAQAATMVARETRDPRSRHTCRPGSPFTGACTTILPRLWSRMRLI